MKLAERLVILRDGRIEQHGPPSEVYRRPASVFVGRFLGSPPMNILDAALIEPGRAGVAGIRPHDVALTAPGEGDLAAKVELVETVGSEQHVHLRLDAAPEQRFIAVASPDHVIRVDTRAGLRLRRENLHHFEKP